MTIRIVEEAECLVGRNSKIKYNEKKVCRSEAKDLVLGGART